MKCVLADGMSREEVARHFGVSVEAIGKTERRAMAKLKQALERRGIKRADIFDSAAPRSGRENV